MLLGENGLFAIMSYCPLLMKNTNFYDVYMGHYQKMEETRKTKS